MHRFTRLALTGLLASSSMLVACGDDGGGDGDEQEVITTVTLTFAPMGGGAAVVAAFDDADGDGGDPPTVDPIALAAGTSYALTVRFECAGCGLVLNATTSAAPIIWPEIPTPRTASELMAALSRSCRVDFPTVWNIAQQELKPLAVALEKYLLAQEPP